MPKQQTTEEKLGEEFNLKFPHDGYCRYRLATYKSCICSNEDMITFMLSKLSQTATQTRKETIFEFENLISNMPEHYPKNIFPEPPHGWQKQLNEFAKERGYTIDIISASYARWQREITKEDILDILSNLKEKQK